MLEDYYECLHHRKEVRLHPIPVDNMPGTGAHSLMLLLQAAKVTALQAAYRRREAETPRDQAPNAGEIRGLGLLERKTDEEVGIKHGSLLPTFGNNVAK